MELCVALGWVAQVPEEARGKTVCRAGLPGVSQRKSSTPSFSLSLSSMLSVTTLCSGWLTWWSQDSCHPFYSHPVGSVQGRRGPHQWCHHFTLALIGYCVHGWTNHWDPGRQSSGHFYVALSTFGRTGFSEQSNGFVPKDGDACWLVRNNKCWPQYMWEFVSSPI